MTLTIEDYYGNYKVILETKNKKGLCLDVDDTLGATNVFWARNHIQNFGNPEKLTAEEIIAKYRYASSVPYWKNNEEAEQWITDNCNSPYGRMDVLPIKGALEGVAEIQNLTNIISYLTGRTEPIVKGTIDWLKMHNFPNVDVLTQPSKEDLDKMKLRNTHEWKAKVLEFLYPNVLGIVEDNCGLVDYLSTSYRGTLFLYSHERQDRKHFDVVCCSSWKDVVLEVRKRYE